LTEFSLTSHAITDGYDDQIVRLLRRMINLKNLALYLNTRRRVFIDRIHFDRMIFHRISQLNSFTFHISTTMSTYDTNQFLSANDIQNTFNDWKYSLVHCSVYYFANQLAVSHIYSTTAKRTCIPFVTKRFHRIPFQFVTDLKLYGTYSFEHHFFEWIARTFPLLKYFTLHNLTPQENERENDKQISSYLHLIKLDLMNTHIDYALQFLCHTNTYVPNLHTLMIQYEQLRTVTNNFTSDLTRNNCRQVKQLLTNELIEYPKDFDLYFPCLKK